MRPVTDLHSSSPALARPVAWDEAFVGSRITIIMHPRREPTRVDALREIVARLRAQGHRVAVRLTFEAGDAAHFAREAVRAGSDLVVAAGGDGTLNEVVNGVARMRRQPRIGIVPIGTANDFAAGLGLPTDMDEAFAVALRGRPIAVDVGCVNGRYFVNVSTGGFGAEATEATSPETKRFLGPFAYLVTGVREFVELHTVSARFVADGRVFYAGEFLLFAVGNGRRTGGGSVLTPRARLDDGRLDLLVIPAMPRLEFLALLPEVRAGTHIDHPGVLYTQTTSITVGAARPLSVNADGEPLHARRLRYSLLPRPITVMAPR